ncbi:MAG: thioester domain-containing protein [Clostridia bacterium]|nr:thioester domain-containing protein [Clostridia bacterium]
MKKAVSFIMVFVLMLSAFMPCAYAADEITVSQVEEMLESIDTLQQMQNKRGTYKASGHYDINTTDANVISKHQTARAGYESYVSQMFARRAEAQQAYDALSDAQKAQLDPSLVARLNNELPTAFISGEYPVSPRDDEYSFEAVKVGTGFGYEVSNHMVSGNIPQTFILVDTSDGTTAWTPSGEYVYGESNYIVGYCCDKETGLEYGTDYKRTNIEDSGYFDVTEAQHIRAILEASYPFITIEEMKDRLKDGGMDADFVDGLTRADIIAAVQMAVWSYANINDAAVDGLEYFASIDVPKNTGIYFYPLHDYTNEIWDWLPGKRQRSYDDRAAYRVNTLAEHLCDLHPVEATAEQVVISDVEVIRTKLAEHGDGSYDLTVLISINGAILRDDDVDIIVSSYSENEKGEVITTSAHSIDTVAGQMTYKTVVNTKDADTVRVEVKGVQELPEGVYLYEPEGGRNVSQTLVGVAEGPTAVSAESRFIFTPDIEITPIEPDAPEADIPEAKRSHYIVFGKTEKIGWYSVSIDGGKNFRPVFGNSNLEVPEGTEMIIKANDVFGDPFTFYINGEAVTPDEEGYIRVTVDGFMLVGALGIPVIAPDVEESLDFFEKIIKAIKEFFCWIASWFKK